MFQNGISIQFGENLTRSKSSKQHFDLCRFVRIQIGFKELQNSISIFLKKKGWKQHFEILKRASKSHFDLCRFVQLLSLSAFRDVEKSFKTAFRASNFPSAFKASTHITHASTQKWVWARFQLAQKTESSKPRSLEVHLFPLLSKPRSPITHASTKSAF